MKILRSEYEKAAPKAIRLTNRSDVYQKVSLVLIEKFIEGFLSPKNPQNSEIQAAQKGPDARPQFKSGSESYSFCTSQRRATMITKQMGLFQQPVTRLLTELL